MSQRLIVIALIVASLLLVPAVLNGIEKYPEAFASGFAIGVISGRR